MPRLIWFGLKKPPSGGFFYEPRVEGAFFYRISALNLLTHRLPLAPLPPLWLGLWVPLLAMAWLIPNHYYPWATFHTDAWVAVMLAIAAPAVILRNPLPVRWHALSVVIALLATVPSLQYVAGMLPFVASAWVSTAYVLGLLMALLIGAHWEMATPGRAADGLFLAIGIAALLSVGLQLREWLGVTWDVDNLQVWTAEFLPGRPSANLGQPNQLATLLLWGLLSCAWGLVRQQVRPALALLFALTVIFGLALTQSRSGIIVSVVLVLATWFWRRLLPKPAPWVASVLLVYFFTCLFSLQYLSDVLGLNVQIRSASLGGESTNLRMMAYRLFADAVALKPWWGYGWNQLVAAQLAVAQDHPNLQSFFMHSHNLFLDFVLWCGLPIGLCLSVFLTGWWLRCAWRVANQEDLLLVLFVLVVSLHAMVELPLHHAYFLLPTGLVMGFLNQRMSNRVVWTSSRWIALGLWMGVSLLLIAIVRDYLRVDESFRAYRLEAARIGSLPPGVPPDVLVLDDLREFIHYARKGLEPDITAEDLVQLQKVALSFPTPSNLFNVAKALAYRHRTQEAQAWIRKMQKVQPDGFDRDLRAIWEHQALTQPAMAQVQWPLPDALETPSVPPETN